MTSEDKEKGMLLGAYYGDSVDTRKRGGEAYSIRPLISAITDIVNTGDVFEEKAVKKCIEWLKTHKTSWNNFISLFKNEKEYKLRYSIRFPCENVKEDAVTNEAFVRSMPISLVGEKDRRKRLIGINNNLTTPSKISRETSSIYVTILRYCLRGLDPEDILERVEPLSYSNTDIHSIFYAVKNDELVDFSKNTCVNSLYCVLSTLSRIKYESPIDIIDSFAGENYHGFVAGSVIGACLGRDELSIYSEIHTCS